MFRFRILIIIALMLIAIVSCDNSSSNKYAEYQKVNHIVDTTTYYLGLILPYPEKTELPKDDIDRIQKEHLENIRRLANEGLMRLAGPFWLDGNVHVVRGIFVYEVDSQREADSLAATDPAVINKRLIVKNYPWVNSKKLTYDKSNEMASYQSVIFSYNKTDQPVSFSDLYNEQLAALKKLDDRFGIVMAGPIIYDSISLHQPHSFFVFATDTITTAVDMVNALPQVMDSTLSANVMNWFGARGIKE